MAETTNGPRSGPGSGGATGKGWMPGQSGNPSGRRKDILGEFIREESEQGKELAVFAFAILRAARRKVEVRMRALDWLSDRGWGRPAQAIKHTGDGLQPILLFPPGTDPTTPDDQLPAPVEVIAATGHGRNGHPPDEVRVEPPR